MIKKITDQKLIDEISAIYGNAGEKGIDINNAKTAGLFLTTDDLETGDIRFGHRIEHNDLLSLRESDEKIEKNAMISCLNYGFVEIQDWMGSDSDIIAAARTSYAGKRSSADGALLRYLLRHQHCYDDQTEVLTRSGFVKWSELKEGDELGCWDRFANTLVYEKPEYLTKDKYEGKMYKVDHGGVDLVVTPEHTMFVRLKKYDQGRVGKWSEQMLVRADELGDRTMVRYTKLAPLCADKFEGKQFPPHRDSQALLELIGFFIGDGCARGTRANGITFHLKKNREISFLRQCVDRVGWEMKERDTYGGRKEFVVYADKIGEQFEQMFYWNDTKKHLPDWCLRLDKDDAKCLLLGMANSDGTSHRSAWSYSTNSKRLAEQMQILGLHAGEACHIYCSESLHGHDPMYRVEFLSRMTEPVINQGSKHTSWIDYSGFVYCAKTRTGLLVVRRNGKIVVSGNTTPFECTALKFRIYMPIVVYRQFFRHRTASQMEPEFISNDSAFQKFSVQNEMSGRYVELPDHFYIPEDRRLQFQSKENRQGSAGQLQEEDRLTARHNINNALKACRHAYQELLRLGVARETARNVLPLTQYTLLIWKIDLKNLLHFLSLRLDPHAQWEVREYAKAIADVVSCLFPETWSAFLDYQLGGIRFSKDEMASMAGQWSMDDVEAMIGEFAKKTSNIREREEFKQKLMRYYGA